MENNNTSGGIGFTGLLQIAFIVLKLCNIINWSWVIVLLPAIIIAVIIVLMCIILVIAKIFEK